MDDESKQHLFWFFIILILLLFAGSVLFFNKDVPKNQQANLNGTKNHNGRVYTVFYSGGVFSPTNLQISIGDTVRFSNESLTPIVVVSNPGPNESPLPGFDSISEIPSKGVFAFTFTTRGIFDYRNDRNAEQKGTIIVK